MPRLIRKSLRALREGDFTEKTVDYLFRRTRKCSMHLLSKRRPVQRNKILIMTYQNDYACNPKYIAEELLRQQLPVDIVWALQKKAAMAHFPAGIRFVRRWSLKFYREAMTARIWIDNALNFFWEDTPKNKDTVMINTWHGSMGLKRFGRDDNKDAHWKKKTMRCATDTDVCISDSDFEDDVYRTTYWPQTEIWKVGHPRNDILFASEDVQRRIRQKVLAFFQLPDTVRLALYAPTFRDSHAIDCYGIDYDGLCRALHERFGGEWAVLARHHFHLRRNKEAKRSIQELARVCPATDYVDMQDLMVAADVGITDYSSWICDFALTKKPGFLFATDLRDYNAERGFYYPLDETPFPIAQDNEELMQAIRAFDPERFEKRRQAFLRARGCMEDGQASRRVVEQIKALIQQPEVQRV